MMRFFQKRRTQPTWLTGFLALVFGLVGMSLTATPAQASLFMRLSGTLDPFAAAFRPESDSSVHFLGDDVYQLPARKSFVDWFRPKPRGKLVIAAPMGEHDTASLLSGYEDYRLPMYTLNQQETIESGDTLDGALARAGVPSGDRLQVQNAMSKVFDLRKLQAGWVVNLTFSPTKAEDEQRYLKYMELKTDSVERTFIVRRTDRGFESEENKLELIRDHVHAVVTIKDGLYVDAGRKGVPERVIANTAQIFRHQLDFSRDLQEGTTIEMLYEEYRDRQGSLIKTDKLLYAKVNVRGKDYELYRFRTASGALAYYSGDGRNPGSRETLSRKPIESGRMSSRYGRRKHPVTGKYKMHNGVDYAAPRGTPIYAAGSGKITYRGRRGAYGNLVEIDHGDGFKTRYAHMSAFKKGQSVDSRVSKGETIGFVGTTGRSTGPHLHYEIYKNGDLVDPLSVKLPVGQYLSGRDKSRFDDTKRLVSRMLSNAREPNRAVARAD